MMMVNGDGMNLEDEHMLATNEIPEGMISHHQLIVPNYQIIPLIKKVKRMNLMMMMMMRGMAKRKGSINEGYHGMSNVSRPIGYIRNRPARIIA
jgi:hypothetical protein